jgi:4-amino-4-deoxy-L-arabinose transferase-like glycosyltransferase
MGAALAVKVLVGVAAIPIGLLFLMPRSRRGVRDLAVAVGSAVVVIVVSTVPWGVARVIDQSVTYHTRGPRLETVHEQFNKLMTTLPDRDLALVVAVLIGLFATAFATHQPHGDGSWAAFDRRTKDTWIVVAWLVPLLVLLVFEKNMWRPHSR